MEGPCMGVPRLLLASVIGWKDSTHEIAVLVPKMYYSERIQSKIDKRKKCVRQSPEEIRCKLPKSPFPVKSHRTCLITPGTSCDSTCETLSSREVH